MSQQKGRTLLIKVGDGGSPEVMVNVCGVTTRNFTMSADTVDTTIPDCDNPGGPVQKTGEPGVASRSFSGNGLFVSGDAANTLLGYVRDNSTFNAEVTVPGDGTYTGLWFVSQFEFAGEMTGNMTFNATFEAAGVLTYEAVV